MASRTEGTTLGPYRVIEQVGEGGMATVYKAYQPSMERYVALKILPARYAKDPKFVERFIREARTIAQLEHKNILPVYDFGEENGTTYLAMRYLDGGTLKEVLAQGRLTLADVVELLTQVCAALDYAHRQGVVHRDVKPANIIIDDEGSAYLTDFGLAKVLEGASALTETGAALGTPAYMAPEQSLGKAVDGRTDIYALGVMLYEMIVGRAPYQADTPMAVALAHIHEPLPLPREIDPNIPESLEAVLIKALAKEPDDRYQTANEMAAALKQAIQEVGYSVDESSILELVAEARTTRMARAVPAAAGRDIPTKDEPLTQKAQRRRRYYPVLAMGIGVLIVLIVGILGVAVIVGLRGREADGAPAETSEVASVVEQVGVGEAEVESTSAETLYDSFDAPEYDGAVNSTLWTTGSDTQEGCEITQQDGVLKITNSPIDQEIECWIYARQPPSVLGRNLESIEVRMQLATDHNGLDIGTVLEIGAVELGDGAWGVNCGINADESSVDIFFSVYDSRLGEDPEEYLLAAEYYPIDYDTWYAIRLQVDPETMTVACLADGEAFGAYTPANVAELRAARFQRGIWSWRPADSIATVYVDDFRLLR